MATGNTQRAEKNTQSSSQWHISPAGPSTRLSHLSALALRRPRDGPPGGRVPAQRWGRGSGHAGQGEPECHGGVPKTRDPKLCCPWLGARSGDVWNQIFRTVRNFLKLELKESCKHMCRNVFSSSKLCSVDRFVNHNWFPLPPFQASMLNHGPPHIPIQPNGMPKQAIHIPYHVRRAHMIVGFIFPSHQNSDVPPKNHIEIPLQMISCA